MVAIISLAVAFLTTMLTESLVLALAGGVLGLLLAFLGIDTLLGLLPGGLPVIAGLFGSDRRAEVEARFPDEYASWEADPFTFAPGGGESGHGSPTQ